MDTSTQMNEQMETCTPKLLMLMLVQQQFECWMKNSVDYILKCFIILPEIGIDISCKLFPKEIRKVFFLEKTNVPPPPPTLPKLSSEYCEGYSSYRADTKSNSNTKRGDNSKSKKDTVVILVRNTPSHPVLHFYQVK